MASLASYGLAGLASRPRSQGAHVQIEGAIRNYQQPAKGDKAARFVTEVVVIGIEKLDRRPKAVPSQDKAAGVPF
jgi:hypothetical protein